MISKETYDWFINNQEHKVLEFARNEASILHDITVNQTFDGDKPYSTHLFGVYGIVQENLQEIAADINDVVPVLCAALFHDSIEDARLTYNDVKKRFKTMGVGLSEEQATLGAEIVYALTNEKGRTRAERANDEYYKGIRNTPYAPLVKVADRLWNMRYSLQQSFETGEMTHMLECYLNELDHFMVAVGFWTKSDDTRCAIPKGMIDEFYQFVDVKNHPEKYEIKKN